MAALLQGKDCNVIEATEKETGTILFLHGLGDTGFGYPSYLQGCCPPHVKAICPTTSSKPVSVNNGYKMPSWFDVFQLNDNKELEDEDSLKSAAKEIHEALDAMVESSGIPTNRIVLGGISQGGCLATYAGLTYPRPLGGILLLSTWQPLKYKLHREILDVNKDTPILQCHGEADPLIILKSAQQLAEFFKSNNFTNHTLKTYANLVHTIDMTQELADVKQWLLDTLPRV